jgi:pyruvate/2-oxoglutarate dehydrogenase complex dihydrolipoamide acyltransferase (E2) component
MSDRFNTAWRKMATVIYDRPTDARVLGSLDIDAEACVEFIAKKRAEGTKITITHIFTAVLARTLADEAAIINCFVRRGRIYPRDDVSIFLAVDVGGKDMSGVRIKRAHTKTVTEIHDEMAARVRKHEGADQNKMVRKKDSLAKLPYPLRRAAFSAMRWGVYEAGLNLRFTGLHENMFGSAMITNIGSFGLDIGYPALMPAGNVPVVVAMGTIEKRAVVRDDEIVARNVLPLSATFDHRIVDGHQVYLLAKGIKRRLADPESLDRPPET